MKKIIALVMCAVMLSASIVSVSARCYDGYEDKLSDFYFDCESYTLGDVNEDGSQNGKDSIVIKQMVAGSGEAVINKDSADFNGDGALDAKDSYFMKTCLAGVVSFKSLEGEHPVYNFTIAGNPISEYSIELPEWADPVKDNCYYAAEEMSTYIEAATGVQLEIYTGKAPTEHVIRYHQYTVDTPENLEMGLRLENYIYRVEDGDLNIHGSLRGNMYATYEILEDWLGIRFIDGRMTYVYKARNVDIPEGTDEFYAPKVDFRWVNHTFDDGFHDTINYHLTQKMNGYFGLTETRFGTWTGVHYGAGHSFGYCHKMATGTLPDESFGTFTERYTHKFNTGTQPDWATWQPCATSDTEYELLFQGLHEICMWILSWGDSHVFRCFEEYGISSMSFSIEDNQNYCQCRNCRAMAKTEGYSGTYLNMVNRAAEDIQEYYPGLKINMIIYDHTVPETVRPHEKMIIFYCGPCCNNHAINSGDCGDGLTVLGRSNACCGESTKAWGDICLEAGAEIWFYYYPVNYHFYLVFCPNIMELYYDLSYVLNECGFNGVYYEGGGEEYLFEPLKAYLVSELLWDPEMTEDEYIALMKEYLHITYGPGYENIYEYICHSQKAGDLVGCFINNHDAPWDFYSWEYIAEHYNEMRDLLTDALEKCLRDDQRVRVNNLIMSCDTLGLSALYDEWYTNGTAETKALYEERYTDLYNYIKNNNLRISDFPQYILPDTIDFTKNLMSQFYNGGCWDPDDRPGNKPGAVERIDFSTVSVGGYVYAYVGEECDDYSAAAGADLYSSSKPSVATVDENGVVTPLSPGVTLIGYEKDGVEKAYVVCVFSADGGPDRSAGSAQIFESGKTYFHSAVVGATEYYTSDASIVDVSKAPTLSFGNAGYAAVTAANASRPFVYSFIVYDRTVE